jgi:hypothetical protein
MRRNAKSDIFNYPSFEVLNAIRRMPHISKYDIYPWVTSAGRNNAREIISKLIEFGLIIEISQNQRGTRKKYIITPKGNDVLNIMIELNRTITQPIQKESN